MRAAFANLAYVVTQSCTLQDAGPEARWLSVLPPNHLLELCCGLLPALAAMSLAIELQDDYDLILTQADLAGVSTVGDLAELVRAKAM